MAIQQRSTCQVIYHSDRGSQYASLLFGLRYRQAGIRPSIGSAGDCYDNALCESFFASLECELIVRRRFGNRWQAVMAIFDYIEVWYNPHRRHSSIDYHSPIDHEKQYITERKNPNLKLSTKAG